MMEQINQIQHSSRPLRVLISGGGTGGHIFPAISIANALRRRRPDTELLFVGAEGRMEMERVPAAGYAIEGLPVAGFDRKRLWRNAGVIIKLMKSLRRARKILREFSPDIAVGVGGYASGPMLKQAQKHGVPTLIQEQNSYAGVTNKLLADKAKAICVAYEGMERFFPAGSIMLTGNPVRANLLDCFLTQAQAKEALGMDPSAPLVLVVGGSLGARTVNEAVAAALPAITATGANVLWQSGKLYVDKCMAVGAKYKGVTVKPFISEMDVAYKAADLIVSRAGAATISEIQILGKAAVLIPSPNVAEDHQRKNAEALVRRGAAVMIPDSEAVASLADTVTALLTDGPRRAALAEAALQMALPGADEKIVDKILEIVEPHERKS
ncbi:MAG: undecaprenyldiphospho-muramoylpentapeptide beta-N-acetylglucosaminyltransferase [Muribaculaceae bacterium]|nr:undecaprenyldiphospho-muramoylpentapeptide beta-N-acetylglucosaminyltransferase [Muribaculaceae bacterium]